MALVQHAAGQRTPHHGHRRACLHVVLRGLYVEHSPRGTVVACPGDAVFKEPEAEHWNHFGAVGAESLRVQLGALASPAPGELDCSTAPGLERTLQVVRALRGGADRERAPGDVALTAPVRIPPQVELLVRLRRGFRERVCIGELAQQLGIHRSHLTRQFTREFGCSPQTYVAVKRCAWAAQEIARDADSLAAIASAAGFADQSHCIRTFKRALGATPSRWGREARGSR